jgi:hypothetical protein
MPRTSGEPGLGPPQLSQIEGLFTAANQIFKGTGSGTGELIDFGTTLNFQFGAAGQLFAGTGVGTGEKLAVGSAGQVLTVGGADPSGLEWSNPVNPALEYNDLLGWTHDPAMNNISVFPLPTAGYIYFGRIPLPAPMTVTNVWLLLETLGLTLVNSYVGLYNSNGALIGQSTDQSTAWGALGATGIKTIPLAGGPYVCTPLAANDFLWAAFYIGTAVTAPAFNLAINGTNVHSSAGTTTARTRYGAFGVSSTATLPSITPANLIPAQYPYWQGIS